MTFVCSRCGSPVGIDIDADRWFCPRCEPGEESGSRLHPVTFPHPTVPGYDADDPKAHALDPGFDPDWMRDRWRGK